MLWRFKPGSSPRLSDALISATGLDPNSRIERTNRNRGTWQEMHNVFWKFNLDREPAAKRHLTTWTDTLTNPDFPSRACRKGLVPWPRTAIRGTQAVKIDHRLSLLSRPESSHDAAKAQVAVTFAQRLSVTKRARARTCLNRRFTCRLDAPKSARRLSPVAAWFKKAVADHNPADPSGCGSAPPRASARNQSLTCTPADAQSRIFPAPRVSLNLMQGWTESTSGPGVPAPHVSPRPARLWRSVDK
jgi:hypothetical protein